MNKILVVLALLVCAALAAPSQFQVNSVPGFTGKIPFAQYAGYLSPSDGEKELFFWFVESQNSPSTDPVVLWLNGGPGCSSFDGFVYEHGPFFFNNGPMGPKQNLTLNPNSWNTVANVIYLDSPAGVGLSYSTNSNDYNTNDTVTASDSHKFLLNFFSQFPEFSKNPFYVAGESYAGIYVPTLAQQIMLGNQKTPSTAINLQGILVGNGVTDQMYDGNAWVPFIAGHSLIPDFLYSQLQEACGGEYWNATSDACNNLLSEASSLVQALNIYDIYEPCYNGPSPSKEVKPLHNLWYRISQRVRDSHNEANPGPEEDVPCIDSSRATAWINQDDLRKAIHALPVSQINWTICSDAINYQSVYSTVIPIYQALLANSYRIFVYSGDVDMCVPNTGTEAWTESLGLPVLDEWRSWTVDEQVAGYVRTYQGLTYATIKGSGHTVPEYKPTQALAFFSRFLAGQPL